MAGFSCFPSRRGFRPASSTASFPDFGDISADVVAPIRATPPRLRGLSARSIAAIASLRSPFPRGSPYVSPRPKRSQLSRRERQVRRTADAEVRPPAPFQRRLAASAFQLKTQFRLSGVVSSDIISSIVSITPNISTALLTSNLCFLPLICERALHCTEINLL